MYIYIYVYIHIFVLGKLGTVFMPGKSSHNNSVRALVNVDTFLSDLTPNLYVSAVAVIFFSIHIILGVAALYFLEMGGREGK